MECILYIVVCVCVHVCVCVSVSVCVRVCMSVCVYVKREAIRTSSSEQFLTSIQ